MLECVYSVLTESRIPIDEYLYKYVDKAHTLFWVNTQLKWALNMLQERAGFAH